MRNAEMINAVVLTASDSRDDTTDLSGRRLVALLRELGAEAVEKIIVEDDFEILRNTLFAITEREEVNLILTTGGTGLSVRDNTPEATRSIIEKEAPGISEAIRRGTAGKTPMAMLSRGVSGVRNNTLMINLPGSEKAVTECFEIIRPVLSHAVGLLRGKTKH